MKRIIPILLLLALLLTACQAVTLPTPQSVLQINSASLSVGAVEGNVDQQQVGYEIYLTNTGPDAIYIDWIEPVVAPELVTHTVDTTWRVDVAQTLDAGASLPIRGVITFASGDTSKEEILAWEPLLRQIRVSAQHEIVLPVQPTQIPQAEGDATMRTPISIGDLGALAEQTTVENFPANEAADGPYWDTYPAYHQIRLDGYILPDTFHEPRVLIYPTHEFSAMSPAAAETIARLQTLLDTRPALTDLDTLPFLPIFNAGQQMHVQETYLDFGTFSGIRYLTQYTQAVNPINNHELFYTFQGLAADGRTYIAAILPIAHSALPAGYEDAPSGFADDFETYLMDTVAQLNDADPTSFTPNLAQLDTLVATVEIHP